MFARLARRNVVFVSPNVGFVSDLDPSVSVTLARGSVVLSILLAAVRTTLASWLI